MKKANLKKTIFLFTVLTVAAILLFSVGCKKEMPYNAKLYDDSGKWIQEEFKKENRVKGAFYDDELEWGDTPRDRTFLVTDREKFESIIVDNFTEFEIDFNTEMIVLYTFASDYVYPMYLKDIKLNDGILKIDYIIYLKRAAGGAVPPYQRWLIVKMDKLELSSVENTILYEYRK